MYMPDCPWEVSTTNRYTITTYEAAVTARRRIKQGETIKYLTGTLVPLTTEESADLDLTQRNFSIVVSSRKKTSSIFLGPARFANHDCDANGRLVTRGMDGMEVIARKNIEVGEEITVTYGDDYFGPKNVECLCHSCERVERNGWTSADAFAMSRSSVSTPTCDEMSDPYSFRRKRKYGMDTASDSSCPPSPSPKKAKMNLSPSKLNHALTPPASSASQCEGSQEDDQTEVAVSAEVKLENAGMAITTSNSAKVASNLNRPSHKPSKLGQEISSEDPSTSPIDLVPELSTAESSIKRKARLIDLLTAATPKKAPFLSALHGMKSSETDAEDSGGTLYTSTHSAQETLKSVQYAIVKIESTESTKFEEHQDTIVVDPIEAISTNILPTPEPSTSATASPVAELSDQHLPKVSAKSPPCLKTLVKINAPSEFAQSGDIGIVPSIEQSTNAVITTNISVTPVCDTIRVRGDYVLTRKLLAQSFDRWVQCQNCLGHFVQPNGYQTRRECPRCERHSKLYGFSWPKTDADPRRLLDKKNKDETLPVVSGRKGKCGKGTWVEGGGDEETGRVMDHRTVHRFLYPEEEREIKRRGLLHAAEELKARGIIGTETPDRVFEGLRGGDWESAGRETSWSGDDGLRRSRRIR